MTKFNAFEVSEEIKLKSIDKIDFNTSHPDFTYVNSEGKVVNEYHDFFYKKAQHYQKCHLSRVLVLVEKESNEVLGYMTLSTSSVQLEKEERKEVYKDDIPFGLSPGMIIGRLCISKYGREHYSHLGSLMIHFAKTIALNVEVNFAACRCEYSKQSNGCRFL